MSQPGLSADQAIALKKIAMFLAKAGIEIEFEEVPVQGQDQNAPASDPSGRDGPGGSNLPATTYPEPGQGGPEEGDGGYEVILGDGDRQGGDDADDGNYDRHGYGPGEKPESGDVGGAGDKVGKVGKGDGAASRAASRPRAPRNMQQPRRAGAGVMAVTGKAGSGKTTLLSRLHQALEAAGVELITSDFESDDPDVRTVAILAPTNKAASVLQKKGVPATTIHKIVYAPRYKPEYERLVEWLRNGGPRPVVEGVPQDALDIAKKFFDSRGSVPGALASAGLVGTDFIEGWDLRDQPLDVGIIDESSMLDADKYEDMKKIFPSLILFGDPAQLAPVEDTKGKGRDWLDDDGKDAKGGKGGKGGKGRSPRRKSGGMVFDRVPPEDTANLSRVHRQKKGNPIHDLAHALAEPEVTFGAFETRLHKAASEDDRIVVSKSVDSDLMTRSPVLVWRNKMRISLIQAFRKVHGAPEDALLPGEPLMCDGIELPGARRELRRELETRGLIKGAQVIFKGRGGKRGFARLHILGVPNPNISVASIVKIERAQGESPDILHAADAGVAFLHAAAITVHKSQGSQWDTIQIVAEDMRMAARTGFEDAGMPLWKRLAYVAITRAENRLIWVEERRMKKPVHKLGIEDLKALPRPTLELEPTAMIGADGTGRARPGEEPGSGDGTIALPDGGRPDVPRIES